MRSLRRGSDDGFTMIEVLVALGMVSVMLASLGGYFVTSTDASRHQAQIQTATRLAQTGMEAARGYGGPALLAGRAKCGTCSNVSAYDAAGYLANTVRWDAAVAGETPTVPLPSSAPETATVDKVVYYRYYFVGKCWQAAGGGLCGTDSSLPVPMVRLVVATTWAAADCPGNLCIRAASSLFSAEPSDPVFER